VPDFKGIVRRLRSSWLRRPLVLTVDASIAALSLFASLLLRFEGEIPERWLVGLFSLTVLLVACRVVSGMIFQLHRWSFLLSGLTDGARVAVSGLLGTGLFMSGIYLLRLDGPPRSVVVLELLLSTAMMTALRFLPRLAWVYRVDRTRARRSESIRAVIIGAGVAGEALLRDLRRSDEHSYHIVGFLDDDNSKVGSIVGGKPVLGVVDALPEIVERYSIAKVLIAIPRLSAARIREILTQCTDLQVRFKILPVSFVYLQEQGTSGLLQDLTPEDLLPREPVRFASESKAIAGRVALVTGAAGSIGSEICRQLLQGGVSRLVMVDINENGLHDQYHRLRRSHPSATVDCEIGDIREETRMTTLFTEVRPQDVFHAAAHKHVPLMEAAPCESVKNNVLGTRNVARASLAAGVARFVFISTDKAVRPSSVMGATKRVGEMLVQTLAKGARTYFCTVRFGNVLASAGSVVPLFREQITSGGPVTVTHPEVRRYFMTIDEAVGLVLKAAYGNFGHLCILEMGEQLRILDLARHMITMSGQVPGMDIPIVFTGLRPGEKLYEELLTDVEASTRRADQRILIADPPPPAVDFDSKIDALIQAARNEDRTRSLALLNELVPTYRRPSHDTESLAAGSRADRETSSV